MRETYGPKTFAQLLCSRDQAVTPHWAGQVQSVHGQTVEVEMHCRKCGNVTVATQELTTKSRVYQVRVTGEDNPVLPARMRPLPYLEESFAVVAGSTQEAHEVAEFASRVRFSGHVVKYYVDGELHLDERF